MLLLRSVFLISGERVDFAVEGDEHIPAVALKIFLRDLQEPLLTFDLYQPVLRLHSKYLPTNEHSIVCLCKNSQVKSKNRKRHSDLDLSSLFVIDSC